MKNNKKIKLGKLNFYIIEDDYINYLSQYDKHIAYNKNSKRPYVGVVIIVDGHYYFAPLFSPKPKHQTYKDNLTFFKIVSNKTKKNLGIIRFSDMIPTPLNCLSMLDIQNKSYGYRRLLSEQYSYINMRENKQKILDKSKKLYDIVTRTTNNGKMAKFYRSLSCDFKLLEQKSIEYII